ncbi:MAG: NAD(P)/FAD-dependent oxidoreductase, partial [Clostridia bacterium]|nr:NAD(P)/FAD-dependent oxidoreductase [Clostridia bacterium]
GRKLGITGKGRCNLTNDCPVDEFLRNVTKNPRFLHSAIARFSPADTMAYFEALGVPLKTERGARVFPVSDRAGDVVDALARAMHGAARVRGHVEAITPRDGSFTVTCDGRDYPAERVILATGGLSYPRTGSDGSGYRLAEALGHTVTSLLPSLVPLESPDEDCRRMQGLSLKNVALSVRDPAGRTVYEDFGEMLFTHFGLSGPMVLSASAHLHLPSLGGYEAVIDLKPALDERTLDARLLSELSAGANRDLSNVLATLLPASMIGVALRRLGLAADRKGHSVTREERRRLLQLLKGFRIPLSGPRPIDEAIVTSGGVDVREVDPRTMESRLQRGLYFAGEILDVDAYTGGFNLQIAFSTAYLAAKAATAPRKEQL